MNDKFKVGDKVYCIIRGPGVVHYTHADNCLSVSFHGCLGTHYTAEGRYEEHDVNPILLTLAEARAKGYDVPKEKVKKSRTVWVVYYLDTQLISTFNINPAELNSIIKEVTFEWEETL